MSIPYFIEPKPLYLSSPWSLLLSLELETRLDDLGPAPRT